MSNEARGASGVGLAALIIFVVTIVVWLQLGLYAAFGTYLIGSLFGIVSLLSYIPFVGVLLQYLTYQTYVLPYIAQANLIPLGAMWVINVFYWLYLILGALATIITSLLIIGLIVAAVTD